MGLFTAFMLDTSTASAITPRTLTFYCENCTSSMHLSSGFILEGMPSVQATITAQYSMDSDPAPNLILQFYVTDINNVSSNLIQIDRNSDTTNADGKCRVIIGGSGTSVPDMTPIRVHVKRVDPNTGQTVIDSFVTVLLRQYNAVAQDTPFIYPKITPSLNISYNDSLLTKMGAYASQSLSVWTLPNRITFTRNNASYKIIFQEVDTLGIDFYGQTLIPGFFGYTQAWYKIQYNMYMFDSDWVTPHRAWAPLGWRHYVQTTCNHEMGHLLGLGHNSVFNKSLMADTGEKST